MTTSRPDSRLGTDLGPYRIERVLGRGGMGVVYLAEQRDLGRKVALKLLAPDFADDEALRARFLRESHLAASIDHANIIPIYEAGEADGTYYLAMRYVEGTDLDDRLKAGPLEPDLTVALLAQVAGALDAAHAQGLVHRDVKPANLLLADEGGEVPHVYLTDFGLTKKRASQSGLTRAGSTLGTLEYMAPEQVEGREVDAPADEYALACVAFQCLTGRVPFVRDSDVAVAMAHLHDAPPSAVALQSELPAGVDVVLARGMAKDREARYETCAALMADLRRALGGGKITTPSMPTQPTSRRRPLAIAAVVVFGLLAIAGLALVSGLGGSGSSASSPPGSGLAAAPNGSATDPDAYPNDVEAALLTKLPTDFRGRCVRGSMAVISGTSGVTAAPLVSVRCTAGNVAFDVKQLDSAGLTTDDALRQVATEQGAPAGDCEAVSPAIGAWSQGSQQIGSVVCYLDGVNAVVTWSYDDEELIVRASFPYSDVKSAVTWWLDTRDQIGSTQLGVQAPFPNAAEAALLSRLPATLREDCQRGSYGRIANTLSVKPIASVRCPQPPGPGATMLEVRQISDFEDSTASDVILAMGIATGGCPPPARADGRWSIGDRTMGAIVCYRDNLPASIIDWSYDDDRILARAYRPGEQPVALFDWWLANAGTISR